MGPTRKKVRTKPPSVEEPPKATEGTASSSSKPGNLAPDGQNDITTPVETVSSPMKASNKSEDTPAKQIKSKSSWYGTWPRKSTPSTLVARESVLADKPTNDSSADLSRFEPKKTPPTPAPRPPSMYLGKSKETLDITMGGTLEEEEEIQVGSNLDPDPKPDPRIPEQVVPAEDTSTAIEAPLTTTALDAERISETIPPRPASSAGWLGGWLSRAPPVQPSEQPLNASEEPKLSDQQRPKEDHPALVEPEIPALLSEDNSAEGIVKTLEPSKPSSSWFGLWSTAAPSTVVDMPKEQMQIKPPTDGPDTVMEDVPAPEKPDQKPTPAAGSSWAFWSTETPKKTSKTPEQPSELGQLAVTGEASQDNPEPAKTSTAKENKKGKSAKRGRPVSVEIDEATQRNIQSEASSSKIGSASGTVAAKVSPPNLLIPSVKSTYRLAESPGILQQIARLLLHSHQPPSKQVFLVKEPPKIKNALAIGIHGLFPAAILRTVIGQPTGTSIRFANHAAAAIRRWTDKNGSIDCEIEKVALEGEGRIGERVDNLWKLLLNWIEHVRKADFILVACHSQGVPVAVMLVAKLIEFGVVSTGRIGVCAMAGVSLGPFSDYKSKLFSGSAGELFEFADPESVVSKRYEDALRVAMHYGVRITYCGSIDDQLVSMESAIFAPASHPYIYRSVFVDGRIHAPDFLSHLVGFALKLRNLGVPDHGLIRELSAPLAGSLYTGEGHSRLYDDGNVYDLAIEFALETTAVADVPLTLQKYEVPTNANPYVLPWIMRGLLEEDFVKTELDHETTELLKQFDDWKPSTKVLKDVKYRLEAVRSKL